MKLREVLKGIEVLNAQADLDMDICDVTYDSRSAGPGTAFMVLKGYTAQGKLFNSNVRFIKAAAEQGASVFICEEAPDAAVPYVLVKDSQKALSLASGNLFGWPSDKLKVIGVTGTNGKTTTTTLIWDIIGRLTGVKAGLIGTNRNVIGDEELEAEHTTPEARELHELFHKMVEAGCRYAVMEVSSHSLAFDRVAGVNFEVGCFTNLSQDHLDYHITMENYLEAKARLFDISRNAVINADEDAAQILINRVKGRVFTFAVDNNADLRAENVILKPDRVEFCAVYGKETIPVVLHIPGKYNVYNALAAIGCSLCLGFKLSDIAEALKSCPSVKGRLEVVPTGRDFTILIDYAVTPDALDSMIKTVRQTALGRVGVLFGCGGDRDRTKRPKMGRVVASLADYVIITSDNPRTEDPEAIIRDILEGLTGITTPYVVIPDRREAIRWAIENAQSGDTIVCTGKGHETYQIVGKTKYHMDEREIIADVLKG